MPTGYTHGVQEGTITDFRAFALLCARAFGATVMMRDEPLDAPIPDEFKPSDFYAEAIAKTEAELGRVRALSATESEAEATKAHEDSKRHCAEYLAEKAAQKARYQSMLAKVEAWIAPGPDHAGLKTFMREQLEESIRFDCGAYVPAIRPLLTGAEWRQRELDALKVTLDLDRKSLRDEEERTAARNKWVRDLRKSLRASE